MLELYHGSNLAIEQIDLSLCKPYKDFGKGFYLTDILQQALDMAYRRTRVVGYGSPIVTKYLFDENLLGNDSLKVLSFDAPSKEWAKFILANRDRMAKFAHDYDIVIGPIADDGVAFQLQKFKDGGITLDELVRELTYRRLNRQYFFGTEKAIRLLQRV